jgi:hypothetical protein
VLTDLLRNRLSRPCTVDRDDAIRLRRGQRAVAGVHLLHECRPLALDPVMVADRPPQRFIRIEEDEERAVGSKPR